MRSPTVFQPRHVSRENPDAVIASRPEILKSAPVLGNSMRMIAALDGTETESTILAGS